MRETGNSTQVVRTSIPLTTIGFITWLVFLILKLCNINNPDFAWLTWFWVWFPLWLPWAIVIVIVIVVVVLALILVSLEDKSKN